MGVLAEILVVDDDQDFLEAASGLLEGLGYRVTCASSLKAASECLVGRRFSHVFLDLMLEDGSGLQLLPELQGEPRPHVTVVTGHPAVKGMLKSLYGPQVDYLIKPLDLAQLQRVLDGDGVPESDSGTKHFGSLVGDSPIMQKVYEHIGRVAPTEANVMLMGESGVGKEVVAKAIHRASSRPGPFVAINCGAIPTELVGSELFGHEKGAFTGAVDRKIGVFEQAQGGTLFLDEVTEMPLDQQTNLLRALETMEIKRVGGRQNIAIDCRIVAATNRADKELADAAVLREDLYFRLAVFPIRIPALRERLMDIPALAQSFLDALCKQYGRATELNISETDLSRLQRYPWPGNVRELRHLIHRAYILTAVDADVLAIPEDFSSPFANIEKAGSGIMVGRTIEDVEKELIEGTLSQTEGDKRKAAEMLGISLKTLYNRLNAYEAEAAK